MLLINGVDISKEIAEAKEKVDAVLLKLADLPEEVVDTVESFLVDASFDLAQALKCAQAYPAEPDKTAFFPPGLDIPKQG